ncbi:MAG: PD40 domain-containing protein [Thermoleophilaceae bacterium]|nr:PD40 domain-containing protein [Thermoleophilaceae bacterium]
MRRTDGRNDHLFIARPDGSGSRQLDRGAGCKQRPIWSPDGRRIAFRFMPRCDYSSDQVVIIGADGRGRFNLSRKTGIFGTSPSWSPDGKSIAFAGTRTATTGGRPDPKDKPAGIYIASTDGRQQRRITPKRLGEVQYPIWSPDGRTIAFQISRGGSFELYSVAPDGSRLKRLTHNEGFTEWPMWSPDSKRIAYGVEGETSALWVMDADGTHKREIRSGVGVPANWAPGEWLVSNCNIRGTRKIGVCAIAPDGSAQLTLLGGKDAGFASWRP